MATHAYAPDQLPAYPETPPVLPGTVGVHVVELADRLAWHEAQPDDLYARGFARAVHEEVLAELSISRRQLSALTTADKTKLAPHIQSLLSDKVAAADAHDPAVVNWLADRNKVSNATFLDFLRRNVEAVVDQQADMTAFLRAKQAVYADDVFRASLDGWMSTAAMDVSRTAADTRILVGDYWATHFHDVKGYKYNARTVVLAQGIGTTRAARNEDFRRTAPDTLVHEDFHVDFGQYLPAGFELFNEAGAEHTPLGLHYGEPHILDPDERRYDSGVYYQYRKLIADMMAGLDPFLFTRAVTSRNAHSQDWRALNTALYGKYGVNEVPERICDRMRSHAAQLKDVHPDRPFAVRNRRAAELTREELQTDPQLVLGRPKHTKPRHLGAAVLHKRRR